MTKPDSTTPLPQPSSHDTAPEWALICAAHLDGALGEIRLAIYKTPCRELRCALCAALVELAKLAGVLEWLGEGHFVLPAGGAE